MKSLGVVFTGPRQAELVETDVPDPAPDEIQLQTIVSLISVGTESWCYRGQFEEGTSWAGWVKYPFRPGYSNVARVLSVGQDVGGFAEGDCVMSFLQHQQYGNVTVPSRSTIKVPEDIDPEEATWGLLGLTTQTGVRSAAHNMGDRAAVVGLGQLGQLITQYLRAMGLGEILAIDTSQARLDMAVAHGATACFRGLAEEAGGFVSEHTDEELADVVYEVTGHWGVFPQALRLAKRFGKVVLIGDSPEPSKQRLTQDLMNRHLTVIGTKVWQLPPEHAHWTPRRMAGLFFEYLRRGVMRLKDLTTHRIVPEELPAMYEALQVDRSSVMGVIIVWP